MLRTLADGGTIYAVIPPAVSADPAKLNLGKLLLYAGYLTAAEQDDSSAFNKSSKSSSQAVVISA